MCGIAGCAGEVPDAQTRVTRMCEAIVHRGPDSDGMHLEVGRVALGFRRLAIIDLNSGDQPIANEDGSVICTCNGEIYNFRQLRSELEGRGHVFKTRSDSEVICHLYEEHGNGFVDHLRGMFAIALWDRRRSKLILARDRLGVKPLYWGLDQRGALFYGSEPSALLASGAFQASPDPRSILDCLTVQYVQAPRSGFVGISKLPPAHLLEFEPGSAPKIHRYWALDHRAAPVGRNGSGPIETADALLREATDLRLISDVPLGAFLSGGIDSSLVVSYMAELQSIVKTFSIDFPDAAFSEGAYARQVADIFGTEHHEFMVEPDIVPTVAEAIEHTGEPFADSSAIPTYLLSELTRRSVTVALSGDGGDEAFGGYERYALAARGAQIRGLARVAGKVGSFAAARTNLVGPRATRGFATLERRPEERYAAMMVHFEPSMLRELCREEFLREAGGADGPWDEILIETAADVAGLQRYLALDLETYLPGDLLVKVDRMSMTHSLEVRSPLLDQRVHEFAARLPARQKLRGVRGKWILRELAIRRGIPRELVDRKKQGFGVPIGEWFRAPLRGWLTDVLLDPRTVERNYFHRSAVETLIREHLDGSFEHTPRLWNLVALELWHRRWIDG